MSHRSEWDQDWQGDSVGDVVNDKSLSEIGWKNLQHSIIILTDPELLILESIFFLF